VKAAILFTTTASQRDAEILGRALIKKRLAACVSVRDGFISFYEWKGKLQKQKEALILIKSSQEKLSRLEETLKKIHPYKNPEFLVLPVSHASKEYLKWMKEVMV